MCILIILPSEAYLNRSISASDGYAILLETIDGNLDGYPDLFSVEKSDSSDTFKFNL